MFRTAFVSLFDPICSMLHSIPHHQISKWSARSATTNKHQSRLWCVTTLRLCVVTCVTPASNKPASRVVSHPGCGMIRTKKEPNPIRLIFTACALSDTEKRNLRCSEAYTFYTIPLHEPLTNLVTCVPCPNYFEGARYHFEFLWTILLGFKPGFLAH